MTRSVNLLLGVHAHQPVGNFTEVLEEAHHKCYRPFLNTLYRFPEFRFSIHFSGWLLDYLFAHHSADMALLREMVKRKQAEVFSGGDTEPVLAVIPNRDRLGQILELSGKLEKKLGQRPLGAWLTERVWEATVVPALADAGIRYVTVDDYHFLCSGRTSDELTGFYTTEEDGRKLDLFPISEALRYRLPFSPAPDAVQYIESLATETSCAAIYFDDIEKFGIWPETYEWVYEKKWLEDFIAGVLGSGIIRTMRYCDYHAQHTTRGIVYLPTVSYIEMNEWTLPAPAAQEYADLVQQAKASGRFEHSKAFLRGGIWKNFFSRYPESNWMHKRMLSLSERFHSLPQKQQTGEMRENLYQAQANDAYWHGLFGGLYLPHLRRAVHHAMVRLEGLLDGAQPRPGKIRQDLDLDGCEEIFLHNGAVQAVIKLDGSASIIELDSYALGHNFADTLARRPEHYHRKIHLGETAQHPSGPGIASAHDRISFKHEITPDDLATDAHLRTLFRDSWLGGSNAAPVELNYIQEVDRPQEKGMEFAGQAGPLLVDKHIRVDRNRLHVSYHFNGDTSGIFAVEINLAMPSCDGSGGRFIHDGRILGGFGQPLELEMMQELILQDDVLGGELILRSSKPVRLFATPHFTVSQSEAGFEKIMQALTIKLQWPLGNHSRKLAIEMEIIGNPRSQ